MVRTTSYLRNIIYACFALLSSITGMAQPSAGTSQLEGFPYVYVLSDCQCLPSVIPDSIFYNNAKGIIFPVNKFNLPKDDAWLKEVKEEIGPWARNNNLQLCHIEIRGASSPEGDIYWNNTLAEKRSKSLIKTLQKVFIYNEKSVNNVVQNPEDYKALLHLMHQKQDPDLPVVQSIINEFSGDRVNTKNALRLERDGSLWKRLVEEYFAEIRYARILLFFAPYDEATETATTKAPAVVSASEVPSTQPEATEVPTATKPALYGKFDDEYPYIYVEPQDEMPLHIDIPDSVFYTNSRGVIFPVNKYHLRKDDEWLKEVYTKVAPWAKEKGLKLHHIEMRGASSPEGPIKWNDFLAEKRSKSLQGSLQQIFDIDYSLIGNSIIQNPEDYKALLHLMRLKSDPDYERVKSVIDKYHGDRPKLKAELKYMDKGKLWKRILNEYFPDIRYARVLLYFSSGMPDFNPLPFTSADPVEVSVVPVDIHCDEEPIPEEEETRLPRRHVLALRTNLLYDGLYMPRYGWAPSPNIAVEFFPKKGRFSYNFELTYPDWEHYDNHHFWQIHDYKFSARCYMRPTKVAPLDTREYRNEHVRDYFQGLYVGPYVQAGRYGIGFNKDDGWEGEYVGAGIEAGYTIPLCRSSRWRIEFTAAIGGLVSKYDPYIYGNPISGEDDGLYYYDWTHSAEYFIKRNHRFTWFGPTELGIHITYDLLYKRVKKKGISVNRWE